MSNRRFALTCLTWLNLTVILCATSPPRWIAIAGAVVWAVLHLILWVHSSSAKAEAEETQ